MDILVYSNVENIVLVKSQPEITRPPKNFTRIYILYRNISALKLVFMRNGKIQSLGLDMK